MGQESQHAHAGTYLTNFLTFLLEKWRCLRPRPLMMAIHCCILLNTIVVFILATTEFAQFTSWEASSDTTDVPSVLQVLLFWCTIPLVQLLFSTYQLYNIRLYQPEAKSYIISSITSFALWLMQFVIWVTLGSKFTADNAPATWAVPSLWGCIAAAIYYRAILFHRERRASFRRGDLVRTLNARMSDEEAQKTYDPVDTASITPSLNSKSTTKSRAYRDFTIDLARTASVRTVSGQRQTSWSGTYRPLLDMFSSSRPDYQSERRSSSIYPEDEMEFEASFSIKPGQLYSEILESLSMPQNDASAIELRSTTASKPDLVVTISPASPFDAEYHSAGESESFTSVVAAETPSIIITSAQNPPTAPSPKS